MSVNTEPMNLKDAFAYMNFLSTSMQTARDLLSPVSPRLDVRTISSDNYLYTSRKVLRYSEVTAEWRTRRRTLRISAATV